MRKQLLFILSFFALMAISFCYSQNLNRKAITDKDYFITEWEVQGEIQIEKIYGKSIIAQYREKGTDNWVDHSISGVRLKIKNLSYGKIYELRLLNVDSLKIINPDGFNITNSTSIKIIQWGKNEWKSMNYAFAKCPNLDVIAVDTPNLSKCKDCSMMFYMCYKLIGNDKFNNWDVSNITNMKQMFSEASFFNQPIGNWDVSNVTNMTFMFYNANSFNQDIGRWNMSNVTDMSYMFQFASKFNQPIGNWNVSNVRNMKKMFSWASSFNQNINKWDVTNVTDMSYMFQFASKFNQPIGNWNVANVTDMSHMFENALEFDQPLNNWNVSNVTDMSLMFSSAKEFDQSIYNWDVSKIVLWTGIFNYCPIEELNKPAKFR